MAEIEHYVDPKSKDHPRFEEVKNYKLRLLPKETQNQGKTDITEMEVGEAVEKVSNHPHPTFHSYTKSCPFSNRIENHRQPNSSLLSRSNRPLPSISRN
jgi:glycyl-tRNA synthetase (class II)